MRNEQVAIRSRDFWVKVVDFLQQNWALIHEASERECYVYFINDRGGVFDEIRYGTADQATQALQRNGFRTHSAVADLAFLNPPEAPFVRRPHPNGPIYSSGRFWQ